MGKPLVDHETIYWATTYAFAREFGWTPEQVAAMDATQVEIVRALMNADAQVAKQKRSRPSSTRSKGKK